MIPFEVFRGVNILDWFPGIVTFGVPFPFHKILECSGLSMTSVVDQMFYFILFYSLVAVSSTLMGFTAYSFRFRLSLSNTKSNAAFGSSSAATSISGSVISCSCHASLLLPLLASVGLSTISGIGLLTAFVEYQFWILSFFIVFNVYLAYRVLNRIQAQHKQTGQTGLK